MSEELNKLKNFMRNKKENLEQIIDDEGSTLMAAIYFILSIGLGVLSYLLVSDKTYAIWAPVFFGIYSTLRIALEAIFRVTTPILWWIFTYLIGNAVGGEANSILHTFRATGYSNFPLVIVNAFSLLGIIPEMAIPVGIVTAVFTIWSLILILHSLSIAFKDAGPAILGFILGGIIAYAPQAFTFLIK